MNRNQCIEKIKLALEFQCENQLAIGCEIEEYFDDGMISDNDDVCEAVDKLSLEEITDYLFIHYLGRYCEQIDGTIADNFNHLKYVSKERMLEIMNKSEEDYQEEYEQLVKDMNDCCC
jgi:hypothetical protein